MKNLNIVEISFQICLLTLVVTTIYLYSRNGPIKFEFFFVGVLIFNALLFVLYLIAKLSNKYDNPIQILEFQAINFILLASTFFFLLAKPFFLARKSTTISPYIMIWYFITIWDARTLGLVSRFVLTTLSFLIIPIIFVSFYFENRMDTTLFSIIKSDFEDSNYVCLNQISGISLIKHTNALIIDNFLTRLKQFLNFQELYLIRKKDKDMLFSSLDQEISGKELIESHTRYINDNSLVQSIYPEDKNLKFTDAKLYKGIISFALVYVSLLFIFFTDFSGLVSNFEVNHEIVNFIVYISFPILILYLLWFHPIYKSLFNIVADVDKILIFDKGIMGKITELDNAFNFIPYSIINGLSFDWSTKKIIFVVLEDTFTISFERYDERPIRQVEEMILDHVQLN